MTRQDLLTIASQVVEIDRLRLEIDRLTDSNLTLHVECGRLEQENAELRDALGRSEDRRYGP